MSFEINPNEYHKWPGILKGYLFSVRNDNLSVIESNIKKDQSSSLSIYARRLIVEYAVPCPVVVCVFEHFFIIGFELGSGKYSFSEVPSDYIDSDVLQGAATEWTAKYDKSKNTIWLIISKYQSNDLCFNGLMIFDVIDQLVDEKKKQLLNIRDEVFRNIGFYPLQLLSATGVPDIRLSAVLRMKLGELKKIKANDLVQDMQKYTNLISVCPENIEMINNRARKLYIQGYVEWDFFTVAIHYATLALESSMRELYDSWLGDFPVKIEAEINGSSVSDFMESKREVIYDWSRKKNAHHVKVKGYNFPRTKDALLSHAVKIGALTKWEQERATYFLRKRDYLSHPTNVSIEWMVHVRGELTEICLIINLMWARFKLMYGLQY